MDLFGLGPCGVRPLSLSLSWDGRSLFWSLGDFLCGGRQARTWSWMSPGCSDGGWTWEQVELGLWLSSRPVFLSSRPPVLSSTCSRPPVLPSSRPLVLSSSRPLVLSSSCPVLLSSRPPVLPSSRLSSTCPLVLPSTGACSVRPGGGCVATASRSRSRSRSRSPLLRPRDTIWDWGSSLRCVCAQPRALGLQVEELDTHGDTRADIEELGARGTPWSTLDTLTRTGDTRADIAPA